MEKSTQEKITELLQESEDDQKDFKKSLNKKVIIIFVIVLFVIITALFSLNPSDRFKEARDAARWTDIATLTNAIRVYQVDNQGKYLPSITRMEPDMVFMISSVTTTGGCNRLQCDREIASPEACVNLQGLADAGYVGSIPVSPHGQERWDNVLTGYYLEKTSTGNIIVGACESENSDTISVSK